MRTDAGFGRLAWTRRHGGRASRHAPRRQASTNRSNTASASSGPGAPSGWYWTVSIGFSRVAQPLDRPVVEVELADPEPGARRQRCRRRPGPRGSARSPGRSPCRGPGPGGSRRGARTAGAACRRRPPARRSGGRGRCPSSGRPSSMTARASATGPSSRAGSPGPGREHDARDVARRARRPAVAVCGRTRTRTPRRRRLRTMFALSPKSTIATSGAAASSPDLA